MGFPHCGKVAGWVVKCRGSFLQCAPVAQLDRASGYEPEGRMFESCRAHHSFSIPKLLAGPVSRPFDSYPLFCPEVLPIWDQVGWPLTREVYSEFTLPLAIRHPFTCPNCISGFSRHLLISHWMAF